MGVQQYYSKTSTCCTVDVLEAVLRGRITAHTSARFLCFPFLSAFFFIMHSAVLSVGCSFGSSHSFWQNTEFFLTQEFFCPCHWHCHSMKLSCLHAWFRCLLHTFYRRQKIIIIFFFINLSIRLSLLCYSAHLITKVCSVDWDNDRTLQVFQITCNPTCAHFCRCFYL